MARSSQLQRTSNAYIYTENGSKNRSGGPAGRKQSRALVPEAGERCHVALLDLYFSKEALQKDNFYLRPLQKKPEDPNSPCMVYVNASRRQHHQSNVEQDV